LLKPVRAACGRCVSRFLQAAEAGFLPMAKRFDTPLPVRSVAALPRAWRGFRIATFSRERDDATLPKIWTLSASSLARQRELWRLP
jgi:hypothetical protein